MASLLSNYFPYFVHATAEFAPSEDPLLLERVDDLLQQLTQPPRVGACTLHTSISLGLPGVRTVRATWPAGCAGADVVFLVHAAPITARMRDRLLAGPAHFEVVESVATIDARWAQLAPELVAGARGRHLIGQLTALHATACAPLIDALRQDLASLNTAVGSPRVALVGGQLAWPGMILARGKQDVDVVVAVRPETGWQSAEVAELRAAFAGVGRLVEVVSTSRASSPVVPGAVQCAAEQVEEVVRRLACVPAVAPLPEPKLQRWESAVRRLEATQTSQNRSGWEHDPVAGCRAFGVEPPWQWDATLAIELVVITCAVGVGFSRVLDGVLLVLVVVAVVFARAAVKLTQLRKNWARGELVRLAQSRSCSPGALWVRRAMSELAE
ncbi:hypothetical protein [Corynebacterium epidermidicanis]|uniref:Uncharacterized protein n=1 Tax=Corynebacterium epidermidicanis TaxID=1050174 RepID=A0A0G3GSS1_9CORY|nr:hypothetical protein [Corynebacterium epidermidicanis]AKK04144.1 hypothetical protein CEPID_11580 [Corynebacterium epidermidicanis]